MSIVKKIISDLLSSPLVIPSLKIIRRKKFLAEWLDENYSAMEKEKLTDLMITVYENAVHDKNFDIKKFIKDYFKE